MRIAALLTAVALGACSSPPAGPSVTFDVGGGVRFVVEVADEAAEQQQGLMGRTSLAPDAGMLFVWQDVRARPFWMKDTLIPLDLIAIADGRVVSVQTMQPCRADPCPFTTTEPAGAALEVRAGTASSAGIVVGTAVSIEGL